MNAPTIASTKRSSAQCPAVRPRDAEYLVFAPEAGERRNAREAQRTDQKDAVGPWHDTAQPAHQSHVKRAGGMVDGAGAEEQKRLEERVVEQMEQRGAERAQAEREEHIAQAGLRWNRREHAFDVVHDEAHRRRKDDCESTDERHDGACSLSLLEQRQESCHEEHARGNHRGGVDEGADGRGALHCIRKPCVERELGALARRARHDAQADQRQSRSPSAPPRPR